ncbi:MAG: HAD-IIIA family hydrolase [Verrucomicrobiaceae bacterium]|nr:MAG: HAD-IIIA family hydrolase [Verrucomicrobiaceae bacterium]
MNPAGKLRCLFLDRDGVVNESVVREGKPYPPAGPDELRYVTGIHELCSLAKEAGWLVIIATNQPDVGRGTMEKATVEAIHSRILRDLPIVDIEVSYDPGQGIPSAFRKPAPGMLMHAAEKHGIDLSASIMVGDRWRDVACGKAAGCRTVFIDYSYAEAMNESPDFTVSSLSDAIPLLRPIFNQTN